MKKKIYLFMVFVIFSCYSINTYAAEWEVVNKTSVSAVKKDKVGNYYFELGRDTVDGKERDVVKYSIDGNRYMTLTDIDISAYPIYSGGLYFIVDTLLETVPINKIYPGFTNSPMYVLDADLNIIKKIELNGFIKYRGYLGNEYYISLDTYISDNGNMNVANSKISTIYKSSEGVNWEKTETDALKYINDGYELQNGNIYYKPYTTDDRFLISGDNKYEILRENQGFIGIWTESKSKKLYKICNVYGERTVDWIDGRQMVESIEKDFLTTDCIYGVEMPEDIGDYLFEADGYYYFEKDNESYYRLLKTSLNDSIKIIYNNKVLAFDTPPTTENDRTLVPMRFLFEQMGADVDWEGETQTATVEKDNDKIAFSINNTAAKVNNTIKTMDVPARLINSKTMIPLRFLSEELGYNVEWDQDTRTVIISD